MFVHLVIQLFGGIGADGREKLIGNNKKFKSIQSTTNRMALNGINMPLAFVGQEILWRQVYIHFGLTPHELEAFFSGPAYLPWQVINQANSSRCNET